MQSVHKGLTAFLREELQLTGVKLEESEAQKVWLKFSNVGAFSGLARDTVDQAMANRHDLMRAWENDHPGRSPFEPAFIDRLNAFLHGEATDLDPNEALIRITNMLKEEME